MMPDRLKPETEKSSAEPNIIPNSDHAWLLRQATLDVDSRRNQSRDFITCLLKDGHGHGPDLSDTNISGLNLEGVDLRRANLTRARLNSTSLRGADLREAKLICPLAERACFDKADMRGIYAHGFAMQIGSMVEADLSGAADITGALFHGVKASGSIWAGANLAGTTFYQCDLRDADFGSANLTGAIFNESLLDGCKFDGARLDEASILKSSGSRISFAYATGEGLSLQRMTQLEGLKGDGAILRGLRLRNCSLRDASFRKADLSDASLIGIRLENGDFTEADLTRATWNHVSGTARFTRAILAQASFVHVVLPEARFDGAQAENMRIVECDLTDACFALDENGLPFRSRALSVRDSNLTGADFRGAYLYRAMFTGDPVANMRLDKANFSDANIIQAYIAASMRQALLVCSHAAYVRINQTDLTDASLAGAELFQASIVKANLRRTNLSGVMPPLWLDRCEGLTEENAGEALLAWIQQLSALLAENRRGST